MAYKAECVALISGISMAPPSGMGGSNLSEYSPSSVNYKFSKNNSVQDINSTPANVLFFSNFRSTQAISISVFKDGFLFCSQCEIKKKKKSFFRDLTDIRILSRKKKSSSYFYIKRPIFCLFHICTSQLHYPSPEITWECPDIYMCDLSQKPVAFYNTDLIQLINKATIGTVITEASEETNIIFAVYISSYSYFCARSTKNRTSVIHQKNKQWYPGAQGIR